jgi:5-methylcytosine-specific restriction enzyme subunit McrC
VTHLATHEWGRVRVGPEGFTRPEANRLTGAAKAHRLGGDEGAGILSDHHSYLRARQCVGVLAAGDCSLEILPKVDPKGASPQLTTLRSQLIRLLDIALGLGVSEGELASLARQEHTLLDILIRIFADRLLAKIRQGLPRQYQPRADDLRVLRGRLDVVRQVTAHAVRPDRLACRFEELSADTPLMQIMRACVGFVGSRARSHETQRRLAELRYLTDGVTDIPASALPWSQVYIDRTNHSWEALYRLARLFLLRDWQATQHEAKAQHQALSLLFPMNDLFEAVVANAMRRALAPLGLEVVSQGGYRHCLGEWHDDGPCRGTMFRTKPDIMIKSGGRVLAIIDTKWKCLRPREEEQKRGISQTDVYQLMAYAQLYACDRLMLLYPYHAGLNPEGVFDDYGIAAAGKSPADRLSIATIDVGQDLSSIVAQSRRLARQLLDQAAAGRPAL